MPALLALIPEILDAIAAFIGAGGWWQIPALIGLFKVEQTVTTPLPAPAQQSPLDQVTSGAAAAVGNTGQAVGSLGQFISNNAPWLAIGGAALLIFRR